MSLGLGGRAVPVATTAGVVVRVPGPGGDFIEPGLDGNVVIASGDRRVDERKVGAITGALARADAEFVKSRTGFAIGGVAPLAHATAPVTLIDRELFRFEEIWAAAGHPNGVFKLAPQALVELTGAPVADVLVSAVVQA